jgi:hypothetical protein
MSHPGIQTISDGRFVVTHILLHLSSSEFIEIVVDFHLVLHEFLWYSLDRRDVLSTDLLELVYTKQALFASFPHSAQGFREQRGEGEDKNGLGCKEAKDGCCSSHFRSFTGFLCPLL